MAVISAEGGWAAFERLCASQPSFTAGALAEDAASRSLTLWLGLTKLGLLPRPHERSRSLCVYVLGAQGSKEGAGPEASARIFALLRRLLACDGVSALHMVFCGPEVGCYESTAPQAAGAPLPPCAGCEDDCVLTVQYVYGLYHHAIACPSFPLPTADLAVSFQPGFWGYDSWEPTVRSVVHDLRVPLLFTSYSWEEADDDNGTLETWGLAESAWVWGPELNPFRSRRLCTVRVPAFTDDGRDGAALDSLSPEPELESRPGCKQGHEEHSDNHHWQCIFLSDPSLWPPVNRVSTDGNENNARPKTER